VTDSSDSSETHPPVAQSPLPDSPPGILRDGWNYEATVQEVEEIMARIESGELDLAQVFEQFGTAVEYLRQCEAFLSQRQRQMDLLIETLKDEPGF
jgi:exodeoxyribonuclease VII small subunit